MVPDSFQGLRLLDGFIIVRVEFVPESLIDPIGRPALARTKISGHEFHILILSTLSDEEKSVTLYHEILEGMTVAVTHAPAGVQDFNESDFEQAAYAAHERFGPASPESLIAMLHFHGFQKQ